MDTPPPQPADSTSDDNLATTVVQMDVYEAEMLKSPSPRHQSLPRTPSSGRLRHHRHWHSHHHHGHRHRFWKNRVDDQGTFGETVVSICRRCIHFLRRAWTGVRMTIDHETDDMEMHVVRYKPDGLDALCRLTKFSRKELQLMYRGFKQECPSGIVSEDTFKGIYAQFFPQGDSSMYAHYVFRSFDHDQSGSLSFEDFVVGLSVLSRGSLNEKLQWAFHLYDINGDGFITKDEMHNIVNSIYDLMGKFTEPMLEESTMRDHVERVFERLDLNKDGVVTLDEFMDSLSKDEDIVKAMSMFDTEL